MLQVIYLILCIFGTVLPYSQFIPFVLEQGLDIQLFLEQLFVNRISAFFGMDVIVSVLVVWVLVFAEGKRLKMRFLWIPIFASVTVGGSLGLPLFLLMRQRQIKKELINTASSFH